MGNQESDHSACKGTIRAVHDAMDVLGGRWKMHIVASLRYGEKRYSEILKDINGISGKMLSRVEGYGNQSAYRQVGKKHAACRSFL